jgi:dihydrofolate reductase
VIISLIAAMADNRVIGIRNTLPWHLPADFRHFKKTTLGKPVLMGRKTYDSIGKPLPGRMNIIVTQDKSFQAPGTVIVHSIEEALQAAGNTEEIMVIGGASFYAQLLPRADRLYLTLVHHNFEGDAWFPAYNPTEWREIGRIDHPADAENPYPYTFLTLERLR